MKMNRTSWIILVVVVVVVFVLGLLDINFTRTSAPTNKPVTDRIETVAAQACIPGDPESSCYTWTPSRTRAAWQDGRIGRKSVRVPEAAEQAIRRAVARRSDSFQKRVRDMSWFRQANWRVNCFMAIGARAALDNELFPKCPTPEQINQRWSRINAVYVDCAGKTLVAGGVGSMWKPRMRNSVIGVVGGSVSCMAEAGLDAATDSTKPFRKALGAGFKSLTVVAARELGY